MFLTVDWRSEDSRLIGTVARESTRNTAGTGGPFFREAVSIHRPVFLSRRLPSPPFPRAPPALLRTVRNFTVFPSPARKTAKKRPISVERELELTAFWRREIPH